jgi:phosphoglycerol transferase
MILEWKRKENISHRQFLSYYLFFTLIINFIAFIILSLLFPPFYISPEAFNSKFTAKYILLLSFLAVVSAYSIIAIEYIRSHKIIKLYYQKIDNTREKYNHKAVIKYVISIINLLLISFLLFSVNWLFSTFSFISIDELVFHLMVPLEGTGSKIVNSFLIKAIVPSLLTIILYFVITGIYFFHGTIRVDIKINDKTRCISILPLTFLKKHIFTIIIVLLISTLVYSISKFGLKELYNYFFSYSTFIEDNYTDTKNVKLKFPENKQNLIFIFMESIEVTSLSRELGGASDVNLIQELYDLVQENINFSDSEVTGGALQVSGTGWTTAAMVAQTSGLPFLSNNSFYKEGHKSFLPGITSLGDILYKNGYNQTMIVGSDAKFGSRDRYYKTHGNQRILDLFTAYENKIIPQDYYVWWGFEDRYLYEYAKKELGRLSAEQEPFCLTLLTVDTHHIGGYICPLCNDEYQEQMSNVISCASRQVADFIDWLKHQEYYDKTTIIIQGDHLSMDTQYYKYIDDDYIRRTINIFINCTPPPPINYIKNRVFSTVDMFPTTLASMGVEIEGNRLGLGTNLFSSKKTVLEIYGIDHVNNELNKRSKLYNKFF